jgi:hypothetical protein
VIRAIGDKIHLVKGWHEAATISSGEKRWDAEGLGIRMATDTFGTGPRDCADRPSTEGVVPGSVRSPEQRFRRHIWPGALSYLILFAEYNICDTK